MTKDIDLKPIDAPVPQSSGGLLALDPTTVKRVDDPAVLGVDTEVISLQELLSSAPGPDIDGGISLTDDEFLAFLEAARS